MKTAFKFKLKDSEEEETVELVAHMKALAGYLRVYLNGEHVLSLDTNGKIWDMMSQKKFERGKLPFRRIKMRV